MMARVPALLATHADLAAALLRAAERVYGAIEDVEIVTNEGLSRRDLERVIGERVERWPAGGIVMCDFWGGSCHVCGAAVTRGRNDVAVVTGVNLPMLLDFLHNRDQLDAAALADRLVQKGHDSIRIQRGVPA